jgi:hypothetical protein
VTLRESCAAFRLAKRRSVGVDGGIGKMFGLDDDERIAADKATE